MPLKKVLIITYYWPPSGGSGVQRWVKFAKYLRDYGWEPIIYTPENPEFPALDNSLEKDLPKDLKVLKRNIWEPYSIYKKLVGIKKEASLGAGLMKEHEGSSLLHNISVWIRGNLFIPDPRKFWIRPSISFLNEYLKNHKVDAIVSTGPPHSMHMIALGLKIKNKIPWLADFRDPWTNIDFFEDLKLSSYARNKHHNLEKKVLKIADLITVVSPTMKKEIDDIAGAKVRVITNGFDHEDFKDEPKNLSKEIFSLSHIGMMSATRNPESLWIALSELIREVPSFREFFKLRLIGKVDISVKQRIKEHDLEEIVEVLEYIPHSEIIEVQKSSTALLLIINNSPNANLLLPGKLFEYLASGRPILCLSPVVGDVQYVLEQSKSGVLIDSSSSEKIKAELKLLIKNWKDDKLGNLDSDINKFSRKELTKSLANCLNEISK